jgi:hypothetical protein
LTGQWFIQHNFDPLNLRFRVSDLMLWTGYLAVVAWLVSLNRWILVSIWIGSMLGFESGKRSDYPAVLTGLSGAVLGALFFLAFFTSRLISVSPLLAPVQTALSAIAWISVLGIAWWLFIGIRRKPIPKKP